MTFNQQYTAYAKWDLAMHWKFYLSFVLVVVGVTVFLNALDLGRELMDYFSPEGDNCITAGVELVAIPVFLSTYFAIGCILHPYRTKGDRILTMSLPVSRWIKLLHNFLTIVVMVVVTAFAAAIIAEASYKCLEMFGFEVSRGPVLSTIWKHYTVTPSNLGVYDSSSPAIYYVWNIIRVSVTYLMVYLVPLTMFFFVNTFVYRGNVIWTILIIILLFILLFFFGIGDNGLGYYSDLSKEFIMKHLPRTILDLVFLLALWLTMLIWGLKRYRYMQVVNRFSH